jgi:hypothetical protein
MSAGRPLISASTVALRVSTIQTIDENGYNKKVIGSITSTGPGLSPGFPSDGL